ncbi:MAG: bifunctional N-acetylglucosamine-phosphate uridyltransferase/glucosamine-phosphate, partial [Pseudomonadota bacterium]
MNQKISAVVLAAGASKRMKSQRSKVLHKLAGRPLLHYPVLAAAGAGASQVIVVASPSNRADVEACLGGMVGVDWEIAIQEEPRGTGHAAQMALPRLRGDSVLLLCGDTPLIQGETLRALIDAHDKGGCLLSMLSCVLDEPHGYGRILRNPEGYVRAVREQRDLAADELGIGEVNAGIYYGSGDFFKEALKSLTNHNAQGEYYATDIVELAAIQQRVLGVHADPAVLQGINDRVQLDQLEQLLFQRIADRHRRSGVTVHSGARVDDTVSVGADSTIHAGVELRGTTQIAGDCEIETGSVITDSEISAGVHVKPYCVISQS